MKYKVLVADDEFLLRMTLEDGLTDLGYQVRTVSSVSEPSDINPEKSCVPTNADAAIFIRDIASPSIGRGRNHARPYSKGS